MASTNWMEILKDLPKPVIMLIGKREVRSTDTEMLIELGRRLATLFPNAEFRSGNAKGADALFAKGVNEVAPERITLFLPYDSHRTRAASDTRRISIDEMDLNNEPDIVAAARMNEKTRHHVDPYLRGKRDRFTMKIAYIFRDVLMVLGSTVKRLPKADAVFYYDDLANPLEGGTGFTVNLAMQNGIKVYNQSTWNLPNL